MDGGRTAQTLLLWQVVCVLFSASRLVICNDTTTTFTDTTSTPDVATSSITEEQPCNVSWNITEEDAGLFVEWSGNIAPDFEVTVYVSHTCNYDVSCEAKMINSTAPFSLKRVRLDIFPNTDYVVDVDFNCTTEQNSKTVRYNVSAPTDLKYLTKTNTSIELTWQNEAAPTLQYTVEISNRSMTGTEETNSTVHTFSNLAPYCDYTFKVCVKTFGECEEWSESLTVKTDVGVPHAPREFKEEALSNTSVSLKWLEPRVSTGPIEEYRIHWRNSSGEGEENTRSSDISHKMVRLTPYVKYTFKVLAITEAGPGTWTDDLELQTDVGVPHAPFGFEAVKISNTSVSLKWTEPRNSTGPIERYRVRWKNSTDGGEQDTENNGTYFTLNGLTPYVNYSFSVLAITQAGPGEWSESLEILTDIGVPHAPTALRPGIVANTSMSLMWTEPDTSTGPILRYRIHWKNSSDEGEQDTSTSSTSYTMQYLTPYVMYTFQTLGITVAGPGEWSEVLEVRTRTGVPHPPTGLRTESVGNTSLSLTWTEPDTSTGPILRYRVHWKNSTGEGEHDTSSNSTSYKLEDLTPYVMYTLQTLGITEAGPGEWSKELKIRTRIGVPHAPIALQADRVGNTSVSLKWTEPGVSTGPILRYRIHWENSSGEGEQDTSSNLMSYTMQYLTPYVTYTLRTLGITEAGPGEWSEALRIKTRVGVPHVPTALRADQVDNTSVSLKWTEPSVSTGPILRYRIHWENSSGEGEQDTGTNLTSYTMRYLTPYVTYTLRTLGITEAGPGAWSEELKIKTSVGVPHAPTLLQTEKVSNTSISLKWSEPDISTGPILRYRIRWKNSTDEGEQDSSSDSTSYTMQYLTPFVKYRLWILGVTEAGPGEWSEELQIRTHIGVPHAPTSLQTEGFTNTSVSLKWIEPNISTGPMLRYRIHWKNSSGDGEQDTSTNLTSYTIQNLTPYVVYTLRILGITEAGPGEWSDELEIRTRIGVPHAPTALKQTVMSNTTVVLVWEEPKISTGPLLQYRVHWKNYSAEGEQDTNIDNRSHELEHLTPYVVYTFKVLALTEAGPGQWSEELNIRTDIGVPTIPRHLRIDRTTDVSLHISWARPEFPRAPELDYVVGWKLADPPELPYAEITIRGDIIKETLRHALTDLLPYTNYSIRVFAVTKAGRGLATDPLHAPTAIGSPRPAIIRNVEVLQKRTVSVLWNTEGPFPGPVGFSLQAWKYPDLCSKKVSAVSDKEVKGSKNPEEWSGDHHTIVEGLSPFGNYSFLVLLKTMVTDGVESPKSKFIQMPPEASEEPLNVIADCRWSSTQATVRWRPPKTPNGRIHSYSIRYGIEGQNEKRSVNVDVSDMCSNQSSTIAGMRPEFRYRITVTASVEGVSEDGKPAIAGDVCILPAGIPYLGNTSRLRATAAAHDHVILEWTEDVFSDYMGAIVRYAVLVGRIGSLGDTTSGRWADSVPPWANFSAGENDYYQATPPGWNPFGKEPDPLNCEISSIEEENNRTFLRCTIGSEPHCPNNETYCNGRLFPDTQYEMKIRGFTRGGYNETQLVLVSTGPVPKKSIAGTIAAVIVILVLIGALSGGCYAMKKKGLLDPITDAVRTRWCPAKGSVNSGLEMQNEQTGFRCIKTKQFAEHVRNMMSDSHLRFSQEFEALKNDSPQLPCTIAETEENRSKNRWMNIFPFDHSRVKLLPLCDEPGSDYINANYIPGFSSPREYIASQGPLPHTVDDFWRMVWEQSVTTVVMLTQCVERGKKKCEQYWPNPGEAQYYGDLVVATVSESMLSSYVIRVLHLQLGSYERQVKQMHFTHWPDFGCPESPEDLINFVSAVRDHLPRTSPGPILVHCSAGVGRTGTFIAVDRLWRQLLSSRQSSNDTVDIYGTVLDLRRHRTNMVQTEDQYIYIHLCVKQLITARDDPYPSGENIYSNVGVSMV